MEKLEPLYVTGGKVKWRRYLGKVWQFLKKLKELPYDLAIPKRIENYVHLKAYTHIFIETLFKIAQKWKQAICLFIGEWINKIGISIQWNIGHPCMISFT